MLYKNGVPKRTLFFVCFLPKSKIIKPPDTGGCGGALVT